MNRYRDSHLEAPGVDRTIILKWMVTEWHAFIWLRIRTSGGNSCENANRPPSSIKCGKFLKQLLKIDSGPRGSLVSSTSSIIHKSSGCLQGRDSALHHSGITAAGLKAECNFKPYVMLRSHFSRYLLPHISGHRI